MVLHRITTDVALSVALLLAGGGIVDAGYVCSGLERADDFSVTADSAPDSLGGMHWSRSTRQRAVMQMESESETPVRTLMPGGMSPPVDSGAGRVVNPIAVIPSLAPPMAPAGGWLRVEGRSATLPCLRTGIFRPPREIPC